MSPAEVVKNRWLRFLIWQSISSIAVHCIFSLVVALFGGGGGGGGGFNSSFLHALLSFISFHLSLFLLALTLFLVASPHPEPSASPLSLIAILLRLAIGAAPSPDSRRRAVRSLASALFLLICCTSGFVAVASLCSASVQADARMGIGGAVLGFVHAVHYLFRKRWILRFPIIQRPLFFSFKVGLSSSLGRALKIATQALVCSAFCLALLPDKFKTKMSTGRFVIHLINLYIGQCAVSVCWELSHHLLQVIHTRRCIFAPPKGSAAEETNPSGILLETMAQSNQRSLQQYLAYLDLYMVCESGVEPWRRSAFFEDTGETYRRVVASCLRPVERLTQNISECFEGCSDNKPDFLSQQLSSPSNPHVDFKMHEAFRDFQVCAWSTRAVAALTAKSKSEDRYGVAQLTACNAAVVSTLLSSLVAVEACLGKKTSPLSAHLTSPANIRWVTANSSRKDTGVTGVALSKRRGGALHQQAYAMADVIRTSLYQIVSAFEADMHANLKASVLEKNWITEGKPLYGTREILAQKLRLLMEFHAT